MPPKPTLLVGDAQLLEECRALAKDEVVLWSNDDVEDIMRLMIWLQQQDIPVWNTMRCN
jgi:hypothetical protein